MKDKINDEMHITWISQVISNCSDHKFFFLTYRVKLMLILPYYVFYNVEFIVCEFEMLTEVCQTEFELN